MVVPCTDHPFVLIAGYYQMRRRFGHTLIELLIIVLFISAMAYIAVPRLQFATVRGKQADAVARKIMTDLRRTRMLAISDAATNTSGFRLEMTGSSPYTGYRIIDLSDSSVVDTISINSVVTCTGGSQFSFGPLGNLQTGSSTQLVVSYSGKTFTLDITSATGAVKCTQN